MGKRRRHVLEIHSQEVSSAWVGGALQGEMRESHVKCGCGLHSVDEYE